MIYETPSWLLAFSVGRGIHGTEPGIDAREVGLQGETLLIGAEHIMIPRQTHSTNVRWVDTFGEVPDTDAVITAEKGLCIAVKTADCIPVLVYDVRKQLIAAIHAGWRGTVGRIVEKTLQQMDSKAEDLRAIIGPGISEESFEVGDEVYEQFLQAGFPMQRLAKRYPSKDGERWHINLKDANRWLLEESGVEDIFVSDIDTMQSPLYYSARRETINTGRNINGIMISY
ncbi:MAG: peptidoglycan editing factor PgeF [Bacteroidaceae bacterium]|jgi:YfiH family protein|nr:peptidoglycan editing factor PgeF [Bacteroidaceae bacterium]